MAKHTEPKRTVLRREQNGPHAHLGGYSGVSDLAELKQALEVLDRINQINGRPSSDQKEVLKSIEDVVLSHVKSIRTRLLVPRVKTLSGSSWVTQFPDLGSTSDLTKTFRDGVDAFIAAMQAGGASVSIGSTLRPYERSYLMHYSWRIAKKDISASQAPPMAGVDIEWVHATNNQSIQGAQEMVNGYQLRARPALVSRHNEGRAIDMTIGWRGSLSIKSKDGTTTNITTTPRTGENTDLHEVGATYGVIKATFSGDPPHWSDDGH